MMLQGLNASNLSEEQKRALQEEMMNRVQEKLRQKALRNKKKQERQTQNS